MIALRWKWILFAIMVLVQLITAISMTMGHEKVIVKGKEFKFRVAPLDPDDPFRGKFMRLDFADREVDIDTTKDWESNMEVNLILSEDQEGYAIPSSIIDVENEVVQLSELDYCSLTIRRINKREGKAVLDYPFDRIYLNEYQAPIAEQVYADALRDSLSTTYALVSVKDGKAVLQDVYINDISIKDLAQ